MTLKIAETEKFCIAYPNLKIRKDLQYPRISGFCGKDSIALWVVAVTEYLRTKDVINHHANCICQRI